MHLLQFCLFMRFLSSSAQESLFRPRIQLTGSPRFTCVGTIIWQIIYQDVAHSITCLRYYNKLSRNISQQCRYNQTSRNISQGGDVKSRPALYRDVRTSTRRHALFQVATHYFVGWSLCAVCALHYSSRTFMELMVYYFVGMENLFHLYPHSIHCIFTLYHVACAVAHYVFVL